MADDEIRRRSACDRCHSQKLRCPKRPDTDVCDRCAKSGSACFYSPFRQKKEPYGSGEGPTGTRTSVSDAGGGRRRELGDSIKLNAQKRKRVGSVNQDTNRDNIPDLSCPSIQVDTAPWCDGIGEEWSSNTFHAFHDLIADPDFIDVDFDTQNELPQPEFNIPPIPTYSDKMDDLLRLPSPEIPRDPPRGAFSSRPISPFAASPSPHRRMSVAFQRPPLPTWNNLSNDVPSQPACTQCIRQLSELSVSLYEHRMQIPPLSIHDPFVGDASNQETFDAEAQIYATYNADDTFRLTQELIDIYPSFMEMFTRRKIPWSSRSSSVVDDVRRGQPLDPSAPSISNPQHLDHSSILLILSCHLRLMDIYDQLFLHMKLCIDQKGIEHHPGQARFQSPKLKIGNYVPPPETAVPMQMLLLLHFITTLWNYATELEGHIRQPDTWIIASFRNSEKDGSEDGVAALSLASAQKVKERATCMLQHLGSLRSLMQRDGFLLA